MVACKTTESQNWQDLSLARNICIWFNFELWPNTYWLDISLPPRNWSNNVCLYRHVWHVYEQTRRSLKFSFASVDTQLFYYVIWAEYAWFCGNGANVYIWPCPWDFHSYHLHVCAPVLAPETLLWHMRRYDDNSSWAAEEIVCHHVRTCMRTSV